MYFKYKELLQHHFILLARAFSKIYQTITHITG